MMFDYWPTAGTYFTPFLWIWLALCVYSVGFILVQLKSSTGLQKLQLHYILAGTIIGYGGCATNYFLWYDINIPPFGNICATFYIVLTAYAIIRHKLLDVQVILRRTVVFAGLLAFVFGVFSTATILVREVLSSLIGADNKWTYIISIVAIVAGYDKIRDLLLNLTDKYLFQKKYDYQKLLKDASKGISSIESLSHLFGLVTHFITMKMRVERAAIYTWQEDLKWFVVSCQRGFRKDRALSNIRGEDELIRYLTKSKDALDIERVKQYLEGNSEGGIVKMKDGTIYNFKAIKKTMNELGAACCIPSFLGRELKNILVIGEKKSGDYFTEEDITVLYTLAQESAIAIENAKLYDEALQKQKELEKINDALEGAKGRLQHALSETEEANKQLRDTQAQLIHEQKMATLGRLAASVGHEVNNPLTILSMNVSRAILKFRKNPDLKVADILEVFQKMEQNINRIKAVVNTLTGLLKKSEKGRFEPLSLKLILEETLPLVQFQTYLDNLAVTEVDFNVPGSVPLVRGDLERLQEVFLNLFINAYHAMSGRQNPRIEVVAEMSEDEPGMVCVHFRDNGKGMDEETVKKIFNYGFTTKPPGRGSGLGLYMCKYIIELHGGDIRVKSKPNYGTTFTLLLPAYEEQKLVSDKTRMEA